MRFETTAISALLKLIPRGRFARLVEAHRSDRGTRRLRSWGQLVALLVTQIGGCRSLREVEALLACQGGQRYHLGLDRVCRSTLATANARRPAALFTELFALLVAGLGARLPAGVRREAVRLIDATTIRLAVTSHGWARRSFDHAGVKLHLVFDPEAARPTCFVVTPCRINDITPAEAMPTVPGTTYVMDRGYYDFAFWAALDQAGCRFVTRLKRHSPTRPTQERAVSGAGILADRLVLLNERLKTTRRNPYQARLREVVVARPDGPNLRLVTNDMERSAEEIALLYRTRWQIELFFKWIKQNLRIGRFLGRSENAIHIQIATALIAHLLVHYAHRQCHGPASRLRFLQLLRANLWQRRPLAELALSPPKPEPPPPQLALPFAQAQP